MIKLKVLQKKIIILWKISFFIFFGKLNLYLSLYLLQQKYQQILSSEIEKLSIKKFSAAQMSEVQQFTVKQQYFRVGYLGICFMMMFTSFNSLQNMVSKLYDQYGYNNLGQTALLFIYFSFGLATFISSYIIKTLGYKKTMFICSLGYTIFQACGLIIVTQVQVSRALVWVTINIGACICGISASALWVAQGGYVSKVAGQKRKSQLFGLFLCFMMSSQIWGNLLGTFVLGRINNLAYFIILTILGVASAIFFLFLPDIQAKTQSQQINLKKEILSVISIIKDKKQKFVNYHVRYKYLNIFFFCLGISVAFYAGFLYKLVKSCINQFKDQSIGDYNKRLNEHEGYVFIILGFSFIVGGVLMNRFSQKFNIFKFATLGSFTVEMAGFVSFVCYYLKSYSLCFVAAFLWGISQTLLQTNAGGIISKVFPGKVEGFSVFRIFSALGVVFILLLNIALSGYDAHIFLTIILVLQTFATAISLNLRYLQVVQKPSLLNQQQCISKEQVKTQQL